jgi:hypothetical protein
MPDISSTPTCTDRGHKERLFGGGVGLVDEGAAGDRGSGRARDHGHRKRVGNDWISSRSRPSPSARHRCTF